MNSWVAAKGFLMSKAVLGMEGSGCDRRKVAIVGAGRWLEPLGPAWALEVGGSITPHIPP